MIVVVCGDRDWKDYEAVYRRLEKLPPKTTIIQGECDYGGADYHAKIAGHSLGFDVFGCYANWKGRHKAAGPIRNRFMLDLKPDRVIAFHANLAKSKGTKDIVNEARRRGIPVELITS